MPKLPNSFLSRLRAQTPASLDPVSALHPDADTLAAFAERALPAPDRASVAQHLAACADCRSALELAFGIEALPAHAARPARSQGSWLGTHLWRYLVPALAAGLALVLLLPRFHRAEPVRIAAVKPPPNPKFVFGAATAVPTAAAVPEPARSSASVAPVAKPKFLPNPASSSAAFIATPGLVVFKKVSSQMLAAAPPPPALADSLPQSVRVVAAAESSAPVQQAPAPSRQDAAAASPAAQSGPSQINVDVVAGQSQALPATDSFANSARAAQGRVVQQQADLTQSESAVSSAEVAQATPAARSQRLQATGAHSAARWEICRLFDDRQRAGGQLCQISADGARRAVTIDPSVELLAVSSRGAEVWAGGAAGALYSSSDNGIHWRRSIVAATGQGQNQLAALTEPIVAIDLSLPGQVRIATSTGETWILEDALWRRDAH